VLSLPDAVAAITDPGNPLRTVMWPSHVAVTLNFLFVHDGRRDLGPYLRAADATLCFADGSALLVSESEAEAVLHALRCGAPSAGSNSMGTAAALAPLSHAKAAPALFLQREGELRLRELLPLAVGADLRLHSDASMRLACALTACQLYNGDASYRQRGVLATEAGHVASQMVQREQHRVQMGYLHEMLFGSKGARRSVQDARRAVQALMLLRGRVKVPKGSCLDLLLEAKEGNQTAKAAKVALSRS
jgi:hypothetical protein